MMLDQVVRILPGRSDGRAAFRESLRASVRATEALTVGKPATLYLTLQKSNGDPVLPSDLIEAHTKKIHLLIIDSSLTVITMNIRSRRRRRANTSSASPLRNRATIVSGPTYGRIPLVSRSMSSPIYPGRPAESA